MTRLQWSGMTAGAATLMVLLVAGNFQAQEKQEVAGKHDAAVLRESLKEVINSGADLFNKYGDHAGCYRLYQGALLAVKPFLAPSVQAEVDMAIAEAEKLPKFADRAFAMRKTIDGVRALAGPGSAVPKMPQKDKDQVPKMPSTDKAPKRPRRYGSVWEAAANVRKVVADFMKAAAADPKVNISREGKFKLDEPTAQYLEQQLVDFISSATGGPTKYQGKSMKEVHKGMGITNAEYDTLGKHLQKALESNGAKGPDITAVMSVVEGLRKEIVEAGRRWLVN